jgi:hypothetical protein
MDMPARAEALALAPARPVPGTSAAGERTLTDADIEAIAAVITSRLPTTGERWLTVEQVAELLGVSAHFVYTHQRLLGVRRLGEGRRAPLRFRHDLVQAGIERLSAPAQSAPVAKDRGRRARRSRTSTRALGGLKARPI